MSNGDNNKLPESIVVKLFDQTKEASNQNAECIKDLTHAVNELTRFLEKQPDLKDIKDCVDLHIDVSEEQLKEINKDTKCIKDNVKTLLSRVKTMIIIVIVTFALMTTAYFVVSAVYDRNAKITSIEGIH